MKTVLIVEDDSTQASLYEQELADEGYRVVRVKDGQEALGSLPECHPDVVVLDINMPRMDGLEALGHLLEQQPQLPVIINTAYGCYMDDFKSWAADSYVIKSSDLTELKAHIKAALLPPTTGASKTGTSKAGVEDVTISQNSLSHRF